jgi:raffinose/stachyose/melibiose transport system substrate-binding protein
MKTNLKLALAFGVLAATSATLVAAQGSTITLKVFTMTAPDSIKEINAAFEKENPGIKVNFEIVPDPQYPTAINARLAGGDAPDVFGGHARQEMQVWQRAGYIEDLSAEPWVASLNAASKRLATIGGKVYQFPVGGDGLGFMVNLDLLAKANVKLPTNITELRNAMTRLQAAGIRPLVVGFKDNWSSLVWSSMIAANTIYRVNENADADLIAGKTRFDSAPWRSVLRQMRDFQNFYDMKIALGLGGYDEVKNEFLAGRVAFIPFGSWIIPEFKKTNPSLKFALIPYPGNPAGTKPWASSIANAAVMVSASSKNKDAAKKYVAFLARTENYKKYATGASLISSLKTVKSDLADEMDPIVEAIADGRSATFPFQTWPGDTQGPWMDMLGKYFAENVSESVALQSFEKAFEVQRKK